MKEKVFGVRKSILKELKLFQLALKRKRRMIFNVELRGVGSDEFTLIQVMTQDGRVGIPGIEPFHVRRAAYTEEGQREVILTYLQVLQCRIRFESEEEKYMFKQEISGEWTPSPARDN
ncbi:hypothetical protein Zmor_021821 [Zophobas morio]|uniref:Uncharacterized protein n=1 Tax=Zophobas morio TaxID=2755281 RepID=A0AA38I391_9CUCU|nr:hypothetical protein Zmor_021821 [Zophobas morio]